MDPGKETLKHSGVLKRYRKKNFKCTQCNKRFLTKQTLKEHLSIHLNIKPHKCLICGQKFTYGSQLSRHKRMQCSSLNCNWPKLTRLMINEDFSEKYYPTQLVEMVRLPDIGNKNQEFTLPRLSELD